MKDNVHDDGVADEQQGNYDAWQNDVCKVEKVQIRLVGWCSIVPRTDFRFPFLRFAIPRITPPGTRGTVNFVRKLTNRSKFAVRAHTNVSLL